MKNPLETLSEPRIGCIAHDCADCKTHRDLLVRHLAEIERLRGEVEALKVDAGRYQWLRDQHWIEPEARYRLNLSEASEDNASLYEKELDAAIDAARSK